MQKTTNVFEIVPVDAIEQAQLVFPAVVNAELMQMEEIVFAEVVADDDPAGERGFVAHLAWIVAFVPGHLKIEYDDEAVHVVIVGVVVAGVAAVHVVMWAVVAADHDFWSFELAASAAAVME